MRRWLAEFRLRLAATLASAAFLLAATGFASPALAQSGASVRKSPPVSPSFVVAITSGYGRALGEISIWQDQGSGQPRVRYFDFSNRRSLEGPLPLATWNSLLQRSAELHAGDYAIDEGLDASMICLHPVAVDIFAIARDGSRKTATGDYCSFGVVVAFAEEAMSAAMENLPGCKWVSPKTSLLPIGGLHACTLLRGNLKSAGQTVNWLGRMNFPLERRGFADRVLGPFLAENVVAIWGEKSPLLGRQAVEAAMSKEFSQADIELTRVTGRNARQVSVDAVIWRNSADDNRTPEGLDLTLFLVRTPNGGYEVVRITQR